MKDEEEEEEEEEQEEDDEGGGRRRQWDVEGDKEWKEAPLTDYEIERAEHVKRNQAFLESLGVAKLVPSTTPVGSLSQKGALGQEVSRRRSRRLSGRGRSSQDAEDVGNGSSTTSRRRRSTFAQLDGDDTGKQEEKDEEYAPSGVSETEGTSDDEDDSELEEAVRRSTVEFQVKKRRNSGGRQGLKPSKTRPTPKAAFLQQFSADVGLDEDEIALHQAIALSMSPSILQTVQDKNQEVPAKIERDSRNRQIVIETEVKESVPRQKNAKRKGKTINFTVDELEAFFQELAGSVSGRISVRNLENAASNHDFSWTREEVQYMIDTFDQDGDGQLDFKDFQRLAQHCQLLKT